MTSITSHDRAVNPREALRRNPKAAGSIALEFLRALRPHGPWVLTAIIPDGGTTTRTFERDEAEQARQFIVVHNEGGENLYYSANGTRTALSKKAKKSDISVVEYVFID